jgi:hypothetical protein
VLFLAMKHFCFLAQSLITYHIQRRLWHLYTCSSAYSISEFTENIFILYDLSLMILRYTYIYLALLIIFWLIRLICKDAALKFTDQLLCWILFFQYNSILSVTKSILTEIFSTISPDAIQCTALYKRIANKINSCYYPTSRTT